MIVGGATGMETFLGVAGASVATSGAVPPMDLKQAGCVVAVKAVYEVSQFLKKNPIPDEDDDDLTLVAPVAPKV